MTTNVNRCDACDLNYDDDRFSGHNCYEVIKGYGRAELARELLDALNTGESVEAITRRLLVELRAAFR
jgi:hypothetical protein